MKIAGDLAAGVFLLAVLYMLVRPSSPAPELIRIVGAAFDDLVHLAVET